ncbi:hypothetical protein WI89_18250 [Burkholderia ubonensis]|nr:hypothetical protein WI89_18250 [Burkholderia ubonensis]
MRRTTVLADRPGRLRERLLLTFFARIEFRLEQLLQEVGQAHVARCRVVRERAPVAGHTVELELRA